MIQNMFKLPENSRKPRANTASMTDSQAMLGYPFVSIDPAV
jgi:hypothetical protein